MKKTLAFALLLILALSLFAGCGSKEVTWADYQAFLKESFADKSPDPDSFGELVDGLSAWEDIDLTVAPWSKLLADDGFDGSTWDEFVAAGGEGSFNADYADDTGAGGEPVDGASGEPTGEPSDEIAA